MRALRPWWPLLLAAPVLLAHIFVFNFVTDDAFISFVYARNLARHGQLVFNLGERVEGYTNFLWTVLLAGFLKVGLPAEIGRVVPRSRRTREFDQVRIWLPQRRDEAAY